MFLGVETMSVPAALRDQLDLQPGFGLLVDYVVPGSPAETAGLKAHDILKRLDDQILTSEDQLSVLVRSFPEGQTISLVILRKGQEAILAAKLRRRSAHEEDRPAERPPRWHRAAEDGDDSGLELGDATSPGFSEHLQAALERNRARIEAATERAEAETSRAMGNVRERIARTTGSRVDYDDARILLRDSTGRVEIRSAHGKRTLTLRDADGKRTFEGPIDTPEQRKAVPADVLPQVEALEHDEATTFPRGTARHEEDGDED